MIRALDGKKTYLAAAGGVVIALGGAYLGVISNDAAVEVLVLSLGMAVFRSALAKLLAQQAVGRAAAEGLKQREKSRP